MDITLPDNPEMRRSLNDLERHYNLFFEFGGGGRSKQVRIPNPNYNPQQTEWSYKSDKLIKILEQKIASDYICTPKFNLTLREKKALYNLVNNKNIVITQTDKNLGLAIIPYNEYTKAMEKLLSPDDYSIVNETEQECIEMMQKQICHLTMTMENKHNNYFLPEETQLPYFHILPKVHKIPLKWRPIVGMHSSPTKRISVLLAQVLNAWMNKLEKLDSINWIPIRDNYQLIYQIEKLGNNYQHVATGDFESLYTKFKHNEILEAMEYLNKILPIPEFYGLKFAKYRFLIHTVISFNYFKALGKIYRQKNGIAMGTNAAVQIAQLTCYAHEHQAIKLGLFEGIFYRRYIDDIIIFSHRCMNQIIEAIYPQHHNISWQILKKGKEANFLDINISIDNSNNITIKRYAKFPRSASFVHYKSNHRIQMKKQVVTNELARLALLCSKNEDYLKEKISLFDFLQEIKGYPNIVLKNADTINWEDRKLRLEQMNSNEEKDKPLPPIILRIPYDALLFKQKNYPLILQESFDEIMGDLEIQRPTLCVTNMPSLVRILARSSIGHPNPNLTK
jgi:hypothetical protein